MSKYTPEFKADVIRFGLSHSRVVTSKKFYVPKSTVGGWVMKAHKAGYSNRSSEGTSVAEGEQLLVDIPSISDHCVRLKRSDIWKAYNAEYAEKDKPRQKGGQF